MRTAKSRPAISKADLNNNLRCNYGLIHYQQASTRSAWSKLLHHFVDALTEQPLPSGYRPPIAKDRRRSIVSWQNVSTLMANLVLLDQSNKTSLSLSLNRNTYGPTRLSAGFIDVVRLAAHQSRGLLLLTKGFRHPTDPTKSRQARVVPTKRLTDLIQHIFIDADDIVYEPPDLITLRDQRTKEPISRDVWQLSASPEKLTELKDIETGLEWFNAYLGSQDIGYISRHDDRLHYLHPRLYSVYTGNFQHGGRFYTGRGGHQQLTKTERKTISFSGEPAIELDFGGLHIRMLYHQNGRNYPLAKDPYAAVLQVVGKDADSIFHRAPLIRDDLKTMLLALINGKGSTAQSIARTNYAMFWEWKDVADPDQKVTKKCECELRKIRWQAAGLLNRSTKDACANLVAAFSAAHTPIKHEFLSDCGLTIQHQDASIAYQVMLRLMGPARDPHCVPCLPVHDSFIVPHSHRDFLIQSMRDSYHCIVGDITGRSPSSLAVSIKVA